MGFHRILAMVGGSPTLRLYSFATASIRGVLGTGRVLAANGQQMASKWPANYSVNSSSFGKFPIEYRNFAKFHSLISAKTKNFIEIKRYTATCYFLDVDSGLSLPRYFARRLTNLHTDSATEMHPSVSCFSTQCRITPIRREAN